MAGKRNVRLKTIGGVCHELAKLYNRLNRDEVELSKARGQGYILNILLQGLKDAEIERRISEIEKKLNIE